MAPSNSRIAVVDALRVFALTGIGLIHFSQEYFAGEAFGYTNRVSPLDQALGVTMDYLAFGKFFTIFSFLFGLSFSLQSLPAGRYALRLGVLFAIGVVHHAFFPGDILTIYAVAGVLLLWASRWPTRWLVIVGAALALNLPFQLQRISLHIWPPTAADLATEAELMQYIERLFRAQLDVVRQESLLELWRFHLGPAVEGKVIFQLLSGRFFMTTGLFLLGLAAGRLELFRQPAGFWRRLFLLTLPVAVISTGLTWVWNPTFFGNPREWPTLAGVIAFDIHQLSLSAIYVAGFAWAYLARPVAGMARLGQMGLTIYLLQSVLGLAFFYGFAGGQLGHWGLASSLLWGALALALIFLFGNWWLARFRQGPAEALWRRLSYPRSAV